jgi:hypothetical protein
MVALRIHALWRKWEKANREDTMSSWWVYHYDAHIRAIFDGERGPMCSASGVLPEHFCLDDFAGPAWCRARGLSGPELQSVTRGAK